MGTFDSWAHIYYSFPDMDIAPLGFIDLKSKNRNVCILRKSEMLPEIHTLETCDILRSIIHSQII